MDTPLLHSYYTEQDPMKRKEILEQLALEGGDPEENRIREELWNLRYREASSVDRGNRIDSFLAFWMMLAYNKKVIGKRFGLAYARKQILKQYEELGIRDFLEGGELKKALAEREISQLIRMYADLCREDRTYGSAVFGVFVLKKEDLLKKMKTDIYETAIGVPYALGLEEELSSLVKAAVDYFELFHPEECPLPMPDKKR